MGGLVLLRLLRQHRVGGSGVCVQAGYFVSVATAVDPSQSFVRCMDISSQWGLGVPGRTGDVQGRVKRGVSCDIGMELWLTLLVSVSLGYKHGLLRKRGDGWKRRVSWRIRRSDVF